MPNSSACVKNTDACEPSRGTSNRMPRARVSKCAATFVLKDFHQVWEAKRGALRGLRNLAAKLPEVNPRKNIVITTPEYCLPVELKHDIPVLELAKPDAQEMDRLLERTLGSSGALRLLNPALRAKLVEAALGLSSTQARRVFQKALVASRVGHIDEHAIDLVTHEKCAIIRESGALELYPYVEAVERIGGLEVLKIWLEKRRLAFSEGAREYGLAVPRTVALIGIPGTGKSLCAKVTAGFVGAELEAMVNEAMFPGFMDKQREIETADLLGSAGAMVLLEDTLRKMHCQFQTGERVPIRGYQNNTEYGQVVIDTGSRYDIGFQRQTDETFVVCADWWGVKGNTNIRELTFTQELNRNYAHLTVKKQVLEQGLIIEEERVLDNGEIELLVCERF